jgi:two-component system, OmpR family, sensor kinase
MLSRLPVRLRLTLAFASVLIVVVAVAAIVLHIALTQAVDESVTDGLRARGEDVVGIVTRTGRPPSALPSDLLVERGEAFAQLVEPGGRVVGGTAQLRSAPSLLTPSELAEAARGTLLVDRDRVPGLRHRARLLALPTTVRGRTIVAVVGASLADRDDALHELDLLLLVGGPLAVLLALAAGYWVASRALRPVEAMRARAASISGAPPGDRLPIPEAHDELRRLGETLNDMLTRIDAAMAHERAFVDDASHELRTPLTILTTELELARRGSRTEQELRAAIVSAEAEAARLTGLANDLLVIARFDQGAPALTTEPLDIADLLEGARARVAGPAERVGREVEVSEDTGLQVVGDRASLQRALHNLADNALAYGDGAIELSARRRNGAVELHVEDRGPGVGASFLPTAFERFSREDAARTSGGSGLGLSIARAVARAHGGDAHLANRDGGGVDAWIALPAEPEPLS